MDAKSLFEILIRENTEMLVAYLRSGVRDENIVEDLYQETVLTAWRRLDAYDRDKPFGPWLRGIAGKMILTHYRKSARHARSLDEQSLEFLNERFDAIQSMQGDTFEEKLSALRDCIGELPEAYERPIRLRYTEQRGLAEIEAMMNLAKETLKKRLARAKSRLSDCLERKLSLGESAG